MHKMISFKIMCRSKIVMLIATMIIASGATAFAQVTTDSEETVPSYNLRGFIQQQFIEDATANTPTRFAMHRVRFGLSGNVTEQISIHAIGGLLEPPQNSPRLVHAYMNYRVHPLLTIRAGQFLVPFGLESSEVIPLNPAIERTLAVRRLNTFNMFSDVGLQARGNWSRINYAIAIINGAGANQLEQINPKDFAGRVGIQFLNNLEAGFSGHIGQYQPDQSPDDYESRTRLGLDINFTGDPVFMRGEYIYRTDNQPGGGKIEMYGGYLLAGYNITNRLEGIARYEFLKPNADLDGNRLQVYTIGANYYFVGRTRLSVNYEFRDDELNSNLGNLFTVQMQVVL